MDIEEVANRMRGWKVRLGKQLNNLGRRATCLEILAMAERICPTRHAFGGGQLFLSWFLQNGKISIRDWADEETDEWSVELKERIMEVEVPRWVMSIVANTNNISQKNTAQIFYPSLVLEWKGLSRTGMDLYAHMGVALRAKQYLHMKMELAQQERAASIKILHTMFPVIWADNYSKIYANPFYRVSAGPYQEANFTAMALMYDSHNVQDMHLLRLPSGRVIPGSSSLMLGPDFQQQCINSFRRFNNYEDVLFYDDCRGRSQEYVNFVVAPAHDQAEADVYGNSPNGMQDLRTFGIVDANISIQQGLVDVFEYILEMVNEDVYQSLAVDPGIYWRAYRLLFSHTGAGNPFRDRFVVHLAKWHPFKELASLVWRFFLPIHLADSFFSLFPDTKCYVKPKLTSILTIFSYHFAIYPTIRPLLRNALLATANGREFHEDLQNIVDFYEIYLPTLRDYIIALREGRCAEVLALMKRICWLFLGFNAHQYVQCMLLNELHISYLQRCNHPSLSQMENNIRTHNEERGEMTLSLLAFSVAADSDRGAASKLDTNYSIMNFCRQLVKDYDKEYKIQPPKPHALTINKCQQEKTAIIDTMTTIINRMQQGTWDSMQPVSGSTYEPHATRKVRSHPRFLRKNATAEVRAQVERFPRMLVDDNFSFEGMGRAPTQPQTVPRMEDE